MCFPKCSQDVTVAAVADLHLSGRPDELRRMQRLFRDASISADVLAICGDFTCHGQPHELKCLLAASCALTIPAVAVLGNHDYESDRHMDLMEALAMARIHVLDGTPHKVHGIGFAGVKGFGGGFSRGAAHAFGERPTQAVRRGSRS